jgi:hypothetical protein
VLETKPRAGRVIVFGIAFWYPLAGVTYQILHYLLGLKSLGYDVYYVEDMQGTIYDPVSGDYTYDYTQSIKLIGPRLDAEGFKGRWACRDVADHSFGMSVSDLLELYRTADICLNVCGSHHFSEEHLVIPNRLYVESDPFSTQVKFAKGDQGTKEFLNNHTAFFTFGENIDKPDCGIPVTGHRWHNTRQPVHLDLWRTHTAGGSVYNTITTWHNRGNPLEWNGDPFYWTKDREFMKIIDLPTRRSDAKFELASGVDDSVRQMLLSHGWSHIDSHAVSMDPVLYRDYIQQSRGEFTVARDQYTRPNTGWFSDRSACYLAAGRPVITGETGFSKTIPSGRGLFGFSNMDQLLAAIDAVESDHTGHCQAAREIGEEYFGSEKVLASLMNRAGLK